METLTEIVQAETAKRIRARDFELATERVAELNRKIAALSTNAPYADAVSRLRRIVEDAQALPADLMGSLGGLIPISGVAGTFIVGIASSALKNIERPEQRRAADLSTAKAALKAAEEYLATFNE